MNFIFRATHHYLVISNDTYVKMNFIFKDNTCVLARGKATIKQRNNLENIINESLDYYLLICDLLRHKLLRYQCGDCFDNVNYSYQYCGYYFVGNVLMSLNFLNIQHPRTHRR